MAARKTTTKKSTKSAPKGKRAAQPQPEELGPILSRPVWGAIWGIVGLLCLLSILPIDGVLLKWLHRGIGALIGKGAYVMPFALIGIAVLLFARPKGPVRLRGTCIALMPLLIGSIIHAFSCANEYDLSMSTLSGLLSTGMEGSSGGLLGGGLYILLEWALSSIGALLILLVLFIVTLLVACRITPQALYDMVRPPEYEYEDEEERERYEAPLQLPNIHEAAAAHAQRREERRAHRKSDFDIPIDTDPPGEDKPGEELIDPNKRHGKAIAPDEYLRSLRDNVKKKAGSIMDLVENKQPEEESAHVSEPEPEHEAAPAPASKSKKTENISETEQEAMNIAIDESQKAPMPVYDYPPIDLLTQGKHASVAGAEAELRESSACLLDTLDSFNIEAQIIGIVRGPSVTRFELTIPRGIKISRITALSDDIALSLGAANVRIAPIPDKVAVGIEVPNKTVNTVFIRECIGSPAFANAKSRLSFAVGKDITGKPVIGDIAKMPHMLIAGTTGSGKSVCINSMLISLLYKSTPEEVRLIMVDPKMVELGNYNGIPHLLIPVVTDPKKAAGALNWAVGEMERRYKLFADHQVRNLVGYNDLMRSEKAKAEQTEDGHPEQYQVLPQIVIVIDELADLMMVAAKEVENSICRIAQKARAAGMHLVVATQRPSADVITGIMKANIPSRIAFAVASQIESRIILDTTGAEKLIGKGDMLYAPLGEGKPTRVQGCFISNEEIEAVIARIKETSTAEYSEEILEHIEQQAEQVGNNKGGGSSGTSDLGDDEDELIEEAIEVIMDCRQASTSMLQRRLKLGYSRAARIIDQIEDRGIIGPSEGSKPRQILISREDWQEMKLRRTMPLDKQQ
ncbi:DNA translocase FtsK [Butyricicoccus sp. AM78-15b2TA]|uniref:DNA translocase FtsK n=2 Tax=Butyricicoccaceae TaxID=3085642 RepID=UPI0022E8FB20|nr:DNA translocase FtsK [Butyricicoccus sp. AM78-15b2TA]